MEVLVGEGVKHVFGYPGGAIMPIYDAMLDYDIHHILTRRAHPVKWGSPWPHRDPEQQIW